MSDWIWPFSLQTGENSDPRVLEAGFGDNYTQTGSDGPNSIKDTFDIVMTNVPVALAGDIRTFLRAKTGVSTFTVTMPAPNDGEITVVCQTWKIIAGKGGLLRDITATFKRRYIP